MKHALILSCTVVIMLVAQQAAFGESADNRDGEVQFNINLGAGLKFVVGKAFFFGLNNGVAESLGTQQVKGSRFTRSFERDDYEFFYVVLRIRKYDANCGPTDAGHRRLFLLSVFRDTDSFVSLGQRETIANTFCFCRFASVDRKGMIAIQASDRDMNIMSKIRDNFISVDGELSIVISTSPNARETNSFAMFNYLSNLLYYCIEDPATYLGFIELSGGAVEADSTLGAFLFMALNPWNNVDSIYDLIKYEKQVYKPSLTNLFAAGHPKSRSAVPNQWTLSIKINETGAPNFLFGGPAFIAFDENDRVWITNNVTQGSPNSSTFCVVLNSDGSPAEFSPVFGGGLLGTGFGVTANAEGSRIFFGNFGWGPQQYNPLVGGISVIASDGTALSPPNGYASGLTRVQGLVFDAQGNLWMTSWGNQEPLAPASGSVYDFPSTNSAIVVYLNFDGTRPPRPREVLRYEFDEPSPFIGPFDVVVDSQGNAFVSNAGGVDDSGRRPRILPSSIFKLRIDSAAPGKPSIEKVAQWTADRNEAFRQVNVNSKDEVYVAAAGAKRVLKFDNDLKQVTSFTNRLNGPWGITFDSHDTMYVANFFATDESPQLGQRDVQGEFAVTVIRDDDETTAELLTLPTGGAPVRLANGIGLYGSNILPSFQPLSRLTGTAIDRVGNLWAINNWKPSAYVDTEVNPGGDGVVIFVGAAAPNPTN